MFDAVNWNTLRLIDYIKDLAESSKLGIFPFSEVDLDHDAGILYDDTNGRPNGDGVDFPIVLDYLIDELHHDIISTYDSQFDDVVFAVHVSEDEGSYVYLKNPDCDDDYIVIDEGRWYFA